MHPQLKRFGGLVILLAGIFVIVPRLTAENTVPVTLRFQIADHDQVKQLDVRSSNAEGQPFSSYWAAIDEATVVKPMHLPSGAVELDIVLTYEDGTTKRMGRTIDVRSQATVNIPLP